MDNWYLAMKVLYFACVRWILDFNGRVGLFPHGFYPLPLSLSNVEIISFSIYFGLVENISSIFRTGRRMYRFDVAITFLLYDVTCKLFRYDQ